MKMMVGSTWKAKIVAVLRALGPEHPRHDPRPDLGIAERPEHERRADRREAEEPRHRRAGRLKRRAARVRLQHDEREDELQRQPPRHGPVVDGPARGRQAVRQREEHGEPADRLQARGTGPSDGDGCRGDGPQAREDEDVGARPGLRCHLSHLRQHGRGPRRPHVGHGNGGTAQPERLLEPAAAAMAQLQHRLSLADRFSLLREHEDADRVIDRIADPGPSGAEGAARTPDRGRGTRATTPLRGARTSSRSAATGSSRISSTTRGLPPWASIMRLKVSSA